MRFFLDTAALDEIRKGASFGILEVAKMGAHLVTLPYKVFERLFKHPLTDRDFEPFASDWETACAACGEIAEPTGMPRGAR
jgi:hypothetical protein